MCSEAIDSDDMCRDMVRDSFNDVMYSYSGVKVPGTTSSSSSFVAMRVVTLSLGTLFLVLSVV